MFSRLRHSSRRGVCSRAFPIVCLLVFLGTPGSLVARGEITSELAADPAVQAAIGIYELWAEQQLTYQDLPGLSVGVIRDQELVWARGFGWSDRKRQVPATPETLYRMGSVTKLFTATAVMQLRDAGKLRLDDPVSKHLPWFSIATEFDAWGDITVWNLLTHTAGLPREGGVPYWTTHEFPDLEELRAALGEQHAIFAPNTTYKYSNLGMSILGAVVEAVSGQSWHDYVDRNVLGALAMKSSTTQPGERHHRQRAISYYRRMDDGSREVFDYYDTGAIGPAANLVSNVVDMARFASLQFRDPGDLEDLGEGVLSALSVREMQRPHWVSSSWRGGRGLGWSVSHQDRSATGKETIVSHGGWIGGNRTHLIVSPARKVAVVAMTNADDGSPSFFAYEAYDVLAPAIEKALSRQDEAARKTATDEIPEVWHTYVGLYSDPWRFESRVLIEDGKLVVYEPSYPPSDGAGGSTTVLVPLADGSFRIPDGETVRFEADSRGRVVRMFWRHEYRDRIGD